MVGSDTVYTVIRQRNEIFFCVPFWIIYVLPFFYKFYSVPQLHVISSGPCRLHIWEISSHCYSEMAQYSYWMIERPCSVFIWLYTSYRHGSRSFSVAGYRRRSALGSVTLHCSAM